MKLAEDPMKLILPEIGLALRDFNERDSVSFFTLYLVVIVMVIVIL